jgi:hypothetical protein
MINAFATNFKIDNEVNQDVVRSSTVKQKMLVTAEYMQTLTI